MIIRTDRDVRKTMGTVNEISSKPTVLTPAKKNKKKRSLATRNNKNILKYSFETRIPKSSNTDENAVKKDKEEPPSPSTKAAAETDENADKKDKEEPPTPSTKAAAETDENADKKDKEEPPSPSTKAAAKTDENADKKDKEEPVRLISCMSCG